MKIGKHTSIHMDMTYLNRNRILFQTTTLLIAIGCSSRVEVGETGTGGAAPAGGESSIGGGGREESGGSYGLGGWQTAGGQATGGSEGFGGWQAAGGTGGSEGFGGWQAAGGQATGGSEGFGGWQAAGGQATGGSEGFGGWPATGGAILPATGGSEATGGRAATGGSETTGGQATGGASSTVIVGVCTPGADQTCNHELGVSSLMGHCENDGSCTCATGYVVNRNSGKCTTHDQTVCYSPTQNIDLAYVERAFGCHCDPNTTAPFCGLDSKGLRVYLECHSDANWHSGNTNNCNGSDPLSCFSPTSPSNALASNGIGCTCPATSASQCVYTQLLDAGTAATPAAGAALLTCTNERWSATPRSSCP